MLAMLDTIERENQKIRAEGRAEGRIEGKIEGIEEGKREGRKEEKMEVARKMMKKKMPITEIIELTGIKKEEFEKIIKE